MWVLKWKENYIIICSYKTMFGHVINDCIEIPLYIKEWKPMEGDGSRSGQREEPRCGCEDCLGGLHGELWN